MDRGAGVDREQAQQGPDARLGAVEQDAAPVDVEREPAERADPDDRRAPAPGDRAGGGSPACAPTRRPADTAAPCPSSRLDAGASAGGCAGARPAGLARHGLGEQRVLRAPHLVHVGQRRVGVHPRRRRPGRAARGLGGQRRLAGVRRPEARRTRARPARGPTPRARPRPGAGTRPSRRRPRARRRSGSADAAHASARSSSAGPQGSWPPSGPRRPRPPSPSGRVRVEPHGQRAPEPGEPRRPGPLRLLDGPVHRPRVPAPLRRGGPRPRRPSRAAAQATGPASPASAAASRIRWAVATSPAARCSRPRATGRRRVVEPRGVARAQHGLADEPRPQRPDRVGGGHRDRVQPRGDPLPLASRRVRRPRRPERRLGTDVAVDRRGPAAVVARPAGRGQRDPRVVALDGRRHGVDPAALLGRGEPLALPAEQPPDRVPVLGAAVGAQRLGERALGLEHRARLRVPVAGRGLADRLDQHPVEVLAQDLVVAERVLAVLHRHREHAAAGQLVQQRAAARRPPQAIAQRPRQPAQHAGVDEELAQVLGQPEQHVLGEVLAQQPAAHLGPAQHAPPLVGGPAAGREVEQLEAGRPALGPAGQHREVARQHRVVVDVAEQLLDLPGAEPQVVRPELEQLARDPRAAEG